MDYSAKIVFMKEFENNAYFWQKVDTLYNFGDLKIIRKKGTPHEKYPALIYPCDFGYIKTLDSEEQVSMEVYRGAKGRRIDALVICADILMKRFEVKALLGLDEEGQEEVLRFLNQTDFQKSIVVRRGREIPSWAESE